ncbi:hypothetical protein, partial [Parafrankia sp. FMc2]|uniref:hypothetical protein n=1 Tax=Parafrankia sp. FMc2 TaxID=3233196 RepID=UPI0034D74A5A
MGEWVEALRHVFRAWRCDGVRAETSRSSAFRSIARAGDGRRWIRITTREDPPGRTRRQNLPGDRRDPPEARREDRHLIPSSNPAT